MSRSSASRFDGAASHGSATHATILLGLVVLAAGIRWMGLDHGLWVDEIHSIRDAFRQPLSEMLTRYKGENDHPFYSVLAHLSMALFGESPRSVRLPAVIFGVATVPALWLLGREVASRAEALAAAAILAVSYHHVWFSQNARGYTATALYAVAGAWWILRGVATGSRGDFVAYGIATALAAYTHLTMVFVSVGHAIALALFAWTRATAEERWNALRIAPIGFAVAAVGTVAAYLPKVRSVVEAYAEPTTWIGTATPAWAALELVRGLAQGWGGGFAVVGAVALAAGSLVFLAGLAGFGRDRPLFALLAVVPPVALLAGSVAVRGVLYPRFFFFAIGPMLLIAVHGLVEVGAGLAHRMHRPALEDLVPRLGVAAALLASLAGLPRNWRVPKQDFEGAIRWVESQAAPGETILTTHVSIIEGYYGHPFGRGCERKGIDAARSKGPTWVVWTLPYQMKTLCPEVMEIVARECPTPKVFPGTVSGGEIRVCRLGALPPRP